MRDSSSNPELPGDFRIVAVRNGAAGTALLAVSGDADLHSAPQLRESIRDAIDEGSTTLVLDLSETTFVDSTALGVLLGGMKRLREHDGRIRLVVPRPEVRRVFEITMLDRIFPLHETRDEALAAVDAAV
ncbi:MAG TPA: STAS domain-containing protein [Gaiellaceae bacterium]|nr:STAS domain-containing protein [Gaiellaceae bacterium]